jgi:DNA-binding LacI/PurR family transcriptional regulator
MSRVTLQSIADEVGVSRMTVSNAFSRPDQLSAALRERILAVAARLGYLGPDPSGRSLATGTTGAIGVLWSSRLRHSLADEVSARFLGAIADELAPDGLALTLLPAVTDGEVVPTRDVALDGAIAYSCAPGLPALGWLERRGLPLVRVDMPPGPAGEPVVQIEDRAGAAAAARHLLGLGHRRIGIISSGFGTDVRRVSADAPADPAWVLQERLAGWLGELAAAGVVPVVVNQPDTFEDSRPAARLDSGVTGVLCLTDVIAHDVLAVAGERGLDVPGQLSVVGFDDHPLAARSGLTTVAQDVDAKGHAAAPALRQLLGRVEGVPDARRLPVELVVRTSTGPTPGAGQDLQES